MRIFYYIRNDRNKTSKGMSSRIQHRLTGPVVAQSVNSFSYLVLLIVSMNSFDISLKCPVVHARLVSATSIEISFYSRYHLYS